MKTADTLADLCRDAGTDRIVVAIGVFDGVHRGHQSIIQEVVRISLETEALPAVVSFWPHPKAVLSPEDAPPLLSLPEDRIRIFAQLGIRGTVHLPFTRRLSRLSPFDFVKQCLSPECVNLQAVCVGSTWRFGFKGSGDTECLTQLGQRFQFRVIAVPETHFYGSPVSSTRIRKALLEGRVKYAARMLNRTYEVTGTVKHGKGLGGETLHCPTANIADAGVLLPRSGVYAGKVRFPDQPDRSPVAASIYVGTAPTLQEIAHNSNPDPIIEVHLLDTNEDLYGRTVTVSFLDFIRPDRKFPSVEILQKQIVVDNQRIRTILSALQP